MWSQKGDDCGPERLVLWVATSIRQFCELHDITVETLLEAYFTVYQDNLELQEKVVREAKTRIAQRVKAGNIRSVLTKMKNINKTRS